MNLNERELEAKNFMERRFIPALSDTFQRANPIMYKLYKGNMCRQSAIFGVKFLEELLPDYEWSAWEATFDDIVEGVSSRYEHAWVYGENSEGRKLLIDLTRSYRERLFIPIESNKYPKNHPEYVHMKELKRIKLDVSNMIKDIEFYTLMDSIALLKKFKRITKLDSFIERKVRV